MYMPENWGEMRRCRLGLHFEVAHERITNLQAPIFYHATQLDGWASLIIHLSGDVTYVTPYHQYPASVLDLFSVDVGETYGIEWGHGEPYERFAFFFDHEFFDEIFKLNPDAHEAILSFLNHKKSPNLLRLTDPFKNELSMILREIDPLLGSNESFSQICLLPAIFRLFSLIYRAINTTRANEEARKLSPLVISAVQIVNDRHREISTLNEVAEQLHVSPDYLSRCFRREMGISVKDYLLEQKLNYGRHLILLGRNVTETAMEAGFANSSYFIQLYKKRFGTTPGKA